MNATLKVGCGGRPSTHDELPSMLRPTHSPRVSVVVNTYNRSTQVGAAIDSVLSQSGVDLELVVVDDGSTDDTQAVLAGVSDVRMRWLRQDNRGLSWARTVGAREAQGEWLLFLDDDDRLHEGALAALLGAATAPSCRVVVGGVTTVDTNGQTLQQSTPTSLDDVLAGTFLIGRTLYDEVGGYLAGLPSSHQTELFLRVQKVLGDLPGAVAYVPRPVVQIEIRPLAGRPQRSPINAYDGARWLLARHPDQYTGHQRATMETIVAINAMRIGRYTEGRRRLVSAVRNDPLSPLRYLRLGAAILTPVARHVWLPPRDIAPVAQRRPLDRVGRRADQRGSAGELLLERDPHPSPDSLFLPWRYRENPHASSDSEAVSRNGLCNRRSMYRYAARLTRDKGLVPVVDIGCGSGQNLMRYVGRVTDNFVGVDGPSMISLARESFPDKIWIEGDLDDESVWDQVSRMKPQLVLCFDIVQHTLDPRRLLSGIRHAVADGGQGLVATPDRSRVRPAAGMGPPNEPHDVRQWSAEEFGMLLESCGFEVLRIVHRRSLMGFRVQAAV